MSDVRPYLHYRICKYWACQAVVSGCGLSGPIDSSLMKFQSLSVIHLEYNNFSTPVPEFFADFSNMTALHLHSSGFYGKVPERIFQIQTLQVLDLSDNELLEGFFPELVLNLTQILYLDLSVNSFTGPIPSFCTSKNLIHIDLSSNNFTGNVPSTHFDRLVNLVYVDLGANIGNYLTNAWWFSLSNNCLSGVIPESICEGSWLRLLDLSNNNLNSTIPSCLFDMSLEVLNLQGNNLHGNISGTFPSNCSLQTSDLNGNHLEGWVPESLVNCKRLELLNLGNNKINDTFPCWLKNLSGLRIMVLRSNRFHGHIGCLDANHSWPILQIIDIASNSFSGDLPRRCFLNWRAMMVVKDEEPLTPSEVVILSGGIGYYQNRVTITNKGLEMKLVKILTIFTSIDFSSNNFQGEIPEAFGDLKLLYVLNLSHNDFEGPIPPSIGNLKQLSSLNPSYNKLSGEIPSQLATLTFLSFLNVSYNQLVGMTSRGPQIQTFTESSFEGNKGLCGFPLNTSCNNTTMTPPTFGDRHSHPVTEIN